MPRSLGYEKWKKDQKVIVLQAEPISCDQCIQAPRWTVGNDPSLDVGVCNASRLRADDVFEPLINLRLLMCRYKAPNEGKEVILSRSGPSSYCSEPRGNCGL